MLSFFLQSILMFDQNIEARLHARREAILMADRNVCEHILGCAAGATFTGVGRGTSENPSTCVPWEHGSRARILVADEQIEKNGMWYRSRHWK